MHGHAHQNRLIGQGVFGLPRLETNAFRESDIYELRLALWAPHVFPFSLDAQVLREAF